MKKKNVNLAPARKGSPCGRGSLLTGFADFSNLVRGLILGLLILALNISSAFANQKGVNIFEYPRDLPKAKIMDKNGKAYTLQDFDGQFLIVIFWSKNCAPCLKEMKTLEVFQEKTKYDGIKLIIVSNEREWSGAKEYEKILKRYNGENLDAYTDRNGDLMSAFGIHSFPNTVLINSKNLEIGRIRGSADWSDKKVIEHMYKIKAENNTRGHINPNIGIKKIKVEEL